MRIEELDIELVYPNPDQPRKHFDPEALAELGASIKENGLHQPIKVRPDAEGRFMIVCGERRYRAHRLIEKPTIMAIVEEMSDDRLDDIAIIENLQRLDITAMEEARAFQRRLDQGVTVEDLSRRLGVPEAKILKRVSLLNLLPEYQELFERGIIEQNQANHLARLKPGYQRLLFNAIRDGRAETRPKLRAIADALALRQKDETRPDPKSLNDLLGFEQRSMFGDMGPTEEQRKALTSLERKILAVTDMICSGFDGNEVIAASKVSRSNAAMLAEKLTLLEAQVRKIRIALEKEGALAA